MEEINALASTTLHMELVVISDNKAVIIDQIKKEEIFSGRINLCVAFIVGAIHQKQQEKL